MQKVNKLDARNSISVTLFASDKYAQRFTTQIQGAIHFGQLLVCLSQNDQINIWLNCIPLMFVVVKNWTLLESFTVKAISHIILSFHTRRN